MAAEPTIPRPEPGDDPDDVLFHSQYGVRTIELNRPNKLNSLNASMCRKIIPRLKEWEKSDMISAVVIAGAGDKAFCAGGDVAALAQANARGGDAGPAAAERYFGLEYTLDHQIATFGQPLVAYMDGITMGGGVGLSCHAPLRIATERTLLAMPETTIGFFPDVGASFLLPRLDGRLGAYLALTSARLDGPGCYFAGLATHYVHSSALGALTERLAELVFRDDEGPAARLRHLDAAIAEFDSGLPEDQPWRLRGRLRAAIDRCFAPDTVPEIVAALRAEEAHSPDPEIAKWATQTLDTLAQRSPTSLAVAARQLALSARHGWSVATALRREFGLARRFMRHPDFTEGVLARLVEKRAPRWQPAGLEDLRPADVDRFFADAGDDLPLLSAKDYVEYPHAALDWLGLPSERAVREVVLGGALDTPEAVVRHFEKTRPGKPGVREKVDEILARMAEEQRAAQGQ